MKNQRGFTLIEIMVSAIIIAIAIVSVVTVARKSREIDITMQHHQQARILIDSCFESPELDYLEYSTLPVNGSLPTGTVLLETRAGGNLTGSISFAVTQDTINDKNLRPLIYKKITATLTWNEPEGPQSITAVKAITQL